MFEAEQVIKRVEKFGDLFEPTLKLKQKLPKFPGIQTSTSKVEAGLEIVGASGASSNKPQASDEARRQEESARQEEPQDITQSARLIFGPDFMAQLYVGTSGWAYPSWKPDFYPAKLAQKKFLQHYATQLNTVEVNFTFRQLVKETTTQKWIEETPAGFRFGVKAHQVITHIKRLKGTADFVPRFLSTIEPLAQAGKLGPVLFQLPPNLKVDAKLLEEFLPALPRPVQAAFEFRHPSWFTDEIFNLLKSNNRALCVAETEERVTPGRRDRRLLLLPLPQA